MLEIILKNIGAWYFERRYQKLQKVLCQFDVIQKKTIATILSKNKHCDYLRSYDCRSIENLPLVNYDDLEIHIKRMMKGSNKVLTIQKIDHFSKSSGTTSRSKYIPISKTFMKQCNYQAGLDLIALYSHHNPLSAIYLGKNFSLTGSIEFIGKKIVGDISALMTFCLPSYYKFFKVPNNKIALLSNWEQKLEGYITSLPVEDIRWIAGVPSWMLIVLEKIRSASHESIQSIFPKLDVFFYGGVHIGPFHDKLNALFDHQVTLWQTYNSSEGFFAMQESNDDETMLLMPHYGIYYEFIAKDSIHKNQPPVLSSDDLIVGEIYEMIITTMSGLYRYRIGDMIQVKSLQPIRIIVYGRTKSFINICGEELMVHNVETALSILKSKVNFVINDFTIAPNNLQNEYYHEWFIAFDQVPDSIENFEKELDEILRKLNSDYDAKRFQDLLLKPLKIRVLKRDVFDKWIIKYRKQNVQVKIPRLSNDRMIVDQLILLSAEK